MTCDETFERDSLPFFAGELSGVKHTSSFTADQQGRCAVGEERTRLLKLIVRVDVKREKEEKTLCEMGGAASRPRQPRVPFPSPGAVQSTGNASPLSRRQQQQLDEAYRTIQSLQNQMASMQRPGGAPATYNSPPMINQPPGYRPASPLLQQLAGQSPPYSPFQQGSSSAGNSLFRENDYSAVANIAGLNPADVALLHREYLTLTRGGTNKIDRVVFRQLLRESFVEANSENIDRAIENIFIGIDRNRDGFIDFPEFIGAFRDLLRGNNPFDAFNLPEMSNNNNNNNYAPQQPLVYSGNSPLVISLDGNQTPYVVNAQGQPMSNPPNGYQCIPLPMV